MDYKIINASDIRFDCPYHQKCGGCNLLAHDYAEQLKIKGYYLKGLLKPYCKVEAVIGSDNPFHYRNKVHAVFSQDKKGNIISGIYEENTHKVVPVEECLIEDERADAIIATIRRMLPSFKIKPYDEDRQTGLLRHVLIRTGHFSGEILVVLVMASTFFPSKNNFVKALLKEHPEITTIVMNINDRRTSMVLGERQQTIYGKGYITDTLLGKSYRISPKSFYQINSVQTEVLYKKAIEYAELTGKETVVDAYCGIGTIGMSVADSAGEVIAVELNKDAVNDAINNAKYNKVGNIRFFCDDAGRFMTQLAASGKKVDVVLMDPPRTGSDKTFIDCVAKLSPRKVVYISCGPETLARDLAYFKKKGYHAVKATGVDMFPATTKSNIETVCLLEKRN